jgi:hypothetical protein
MSESAITLRGKFEPSDNTIIMANQKNKKTRPHAKTKPKPQKELKNLMFSCWNKSYFMIFMKIKLCEVEVFHIPYTSLQQN